MIELLGLERLKRLTKFLQDVERGNAGTLYPGDVRALMDKIATLRRQIAEANELLAEVKQELFGDSVPADWRKAIRAMKAREEAILALGGEPWAGLQWSNEPPTEPGWYWWRPGRAYYPSQEEREVVRVVVDDAGELVARLASGTRVDRFGGWYGQWAGPLVPPEGGAG